jgi:4-hydroxybenzoate polyprenyltransferase
MDFDRGERLRSIPARFGADGALVWARALHLLAAFAIAAAGILAGRGLGWLVGSLLLAVVLGAEHLYATPGGVLRKERIGAAFFSFNAFASVAFAACALVDLLVRGRS